jgi:hypothetical protein
VLIDFAISVEGHTIDSLKLLALELAIKAEKAPSALLVVDGLYCLPSRIAERLLI